MACCGAPWGNRPCFCWACCGCGGTGCCGGGGCCCCTSGWYIGWPEETAAVRSARCCRRWVAGSRDWDTLPEGLAIDPAIAAAARSARSRSAARSAACRLSAITRASCSACAFSICSCSKRRASLSCRSFIIILGPRMPALGELVGAGMGICGREVGMPLPFESSSKRSAIFAFSSSWSAESLYG